MAAERSSVHRTPVRGGGYLPAGIVQQAGDLPGLQIQQHRVLPVIHLLALAEVEEHHVGAPLQGGYRAVVVQRHAGGTVVVAGDNALVFTPVDGVCVGHAVPDGGKAGGVCLQRDQLISGDGPIVDVQNGAVVGPVHLEDGIVVVVAAGAGVRQADILHLHLLADGTLGQLRLLRLIPGGDGHLLSLLQPEEGKHCRPQLGAGGHGRQEGAGQHGRRSQSGEPRPPPPMTGNPGGGFQTGLDAFFQLQRRGQAIQRTPVFLPIHTEPSFPGSSSSFSRSRPRFRRIFTAEGERRSN